MKLASYHGVRDGAMAFSTYALRLRLMLSFKPCATHSEVMFEPCDGPEVAALMPDGSLEPDTEGRLWGFSSVGLERIPDFSSYRAGELGGSRFKRIDFSTPKWSLQKTCRSALVAARRAVATQGKCYDWPLIASFLLWFVPESERHADCSEVCAYLLGILRPGRLDPVTLEAVAASFEEPQIQ